MGFRFPPGCRGGPSSKEGETVKRGFTIWFTGLSGAGKTTISRLVEAELRRRDFQVEVLDGDVVRQNMSQGLGFSKADRDTNIRRIAFVSKLLTRNNVATLVAAISPYREAREEARKEIGNFVEVYVKCPLETCMARDDKGLYKRALEGTISNFTGVSDPYEEPLEPEIVLYTDQETPEQCAARVLRRLQELKYIT
ncbi:MAG: adenylyl-sulfate kinase [Candidatus Methylomirabilaceae bacterium]